MEDRKLSVTLTGPAKIDGVREPAGKTVTVSMEVALQLAHSDAINPDAAKRILDGFDLSDVALESDFQAAVERAAEEKAKVLASSLVETAVWGAVETAKVEIANLEKELATYRQSLETRDNQLIEMTALAEKAQKSVSGLTAELETEAKARTEAETKLAEAQAELAKLTKPDAETGKAEDGKSGKSTK